MQAYSPEGVQDWDRPVDLYYEDAVHTDPVLGRNIAFWTGKLAPNGIVCGDDYRPRFRDVRAAAEGVAAACGRKLWVVDFFWCVLPDAAAVPGVTAVEATLAALAQEVARDNASKPAQVRVHPLVPIAAAGAGFADPRPIMRVVNDGTRPWPAAPAGALRLEMALFDADGATLGREEVPLGVDQLRFDEPCNVGVALPAPRSNAARLRMRVIGGVDEAGATVLPFEQEFAFAQPAPAVAQQPTPVPAPVRAVSLVAPSPSVFDFAERAS